jgi:accessory gene regulator protein AgrB
MIISLFIGILVLTIQVLFTFFHIPFNIEACHLNGTIGAYGDALLEVARELACTVVSYFHLPLLSGLDGSLSVFGYGASAGSHSLVDYQWLLANVRENERTTYNGLFLRELAKIVNQVVKLDLGWFLGHCGHA